jgi:hypothetical protein
MFCLFLTFGSYAEETTTPEAPKEFKSLQENPSAVHQLRELKNCTITYYNIGVYANIGGSIVELIEGDEATREKFRLIFVRANEQHQALQKKLDTLINLLLKGNYHPLEIRLILDDAQNTMLGIITQMMSDVMTDPSRTNDMLRIMMEGTNKCDQEFLK